MKTSKTKLITLSSIFAALIFVTTAYILHIPIPGIGGYIHIGDMFLFVAACLLPTPYAMAAAAIGAGLSDLIYAPVYFIPTIIIKPVMVLFFVKRSDKMLTLRNIISAALSGITMLAGYYIAEVIMYKGDFIKPLLALPFGAIQPIVCIIIFAVAAYALDKTKLFKNII